MIEGFIFFMLLLVLLGLAALVFDIFTLVHQASNKRWGWFWITLLFTLFAGSGVLVSVIYWIVYITSKPRRNNGKKKKKKR